MMTKKPNGKTHDGSKPLDHADRWANACRKYYLIRLGLNGCGELQCTKEGETHDILDQAELKALDAMRRGNLEDLERAVEV